jgi:hypothetical protein
MRRRRPGSRKGVRVVRVFHVPINAANPIESQQALGQGEDLPLHRAGGIGSKGKDVGWLLRCADHRLLLQFMSYDDRIVNGMC